MNRYLPALFALFVLIACEPDEPDEPEVSPTISFRTASGYTYATDTIGLQDTVRVGIDVRKGTDDLESFYVRVKYSGISDIENIELIEISAGDFSYEHVIVARNSTGTEEWIFGVQEEDGDTFDRRVLLVVE